MTKTNLGQMGAHTPYRLTIACLFLSYHPKKNVSSAFGHNATYGI